MNVHRDLGSWRKARKGSEYAGRSVGFVPTMGALHAGHRSLLERARAENDRVVLSIFVNPTQFDDASDLARYPQTLDADLGIAAGLADAVVVPAAWELYADDYRFRIVENTLSQQLEGQFRPGHFDGVLTVVLKLLNIVQPDRAYFGEKDWQQLQLVRRMVDAFFVPCEIIGCPIVRDSDGLALSSRNRRLTPSGRLQAVHFPRILETAPDAETAAAQLREQGLKVDYVEDRDGRRLGAVRVDDVRLIDNVQR